MKWLRSLRITNLFNLVTLKRYNRSRNCFQSFYLKITAVVKNKEGFLVAKTFSSTILVTRIGEYNLYGSITWWWHAVMRNILYIQRNIACTVRKTIRNIIVYLGDLFKNPIAITDINGYLAI
jgi:hypothetical protein